jgi:hypothetical protein
MRTHTLALAGDSGMLSVRLSRDGMSVQYSLTTQAGLPIAGPCKSEAELEALCYRMLSIQRRKAELVALGQDARLAVAVTHAR